MMGDIMWKCTTCRYENCVCPPKSQSPATGLVPVYVREWFTAPQPPIDVNPDVQHIVAKAYLAADVGAVMDEKDRNLLGLCHQNGALMIEVHDLKKALAQLRGGGASVPLDEHNRIVADTIKSLDAERTSFEREIADLTMKLAAMTEERDRQLTAKVSFMEAVESMRTERTGLQRQLAKAQVENVRLQEAIRKHDGNV